VVIIIKNWNSK